MYYVIGSGPAGLACVQALLAEGKRVCVLDSGLGLESDRQEAVQALAAGPPGGWTPAATAFMRQGISSDRSGIPLKLAYGSDYPFRRPIGATSVECRGAEIKPSYAFGGLSTVWGGATLPYRQEDIEDWPIRIEDLEPGYRAVLQWMPLAAREDGLARLFPLYTDKNSPLPAGRQAGGLLEDLEGHRARLNAGGVYFGSSRLAVRARTPDGRAACVQCGLCMYGCPHGLIYSSGQTFAHLIAQGRIEYRAGITVRTVEEGSGGVLIRAVDPDGYPVTVEGERVFLGAGVVNTTAILLRSLGLYDRPVAIQDSQYFLMPLLRLRGTDQVAREGLHTLAQVFLEVFDKAISPHAVHLQVYTYNELYRGPLLAKLGSLKRLFPLEAFMGRLLLMQGFLHSDHSSPISASLQRQGSGDQLVLSSAADPGTKRLVHRLALKLLRLAGQTGVLPLLPMLQMGQAGRGFHSGGSFPMSAEPRGLASDALGRPQGLRRVHAVDATVLPSIPATTITYTVMANAYRIGTLAARLEAGEGP
jgi:choline dehydrogenase-like flavoprotein